MEQGPLLRRGHPRPRSSGDRVAISSDALSLETKSAIQGFLEVSWQSSFYEARFHRTWREIAQFYNFIWAWLVHYFNLHMHACISSNGIIVCNCMHRKPCLPSKGKEIMEYVHTVISHILKKSSNWLFDKTLSLLFQAGK